MHTLGLLHTASLWWGNLSDGAPELQEIWQPTTTNNMPS